MALSTEVEISFADQFIAFLEIAEEFDEEGECEVTYNMLLKLHAPVDLLDKLRAAFEEAQSE